MTMITASTALTIFIMNIHHCGPDAKPVPKWAKKVILQYMARICFVYEVGENCMSVELERQEPSLVSNPNCTMNGQAGPGREDHDIKSGQETVGSAIMEDKEEIDQILNPLGSVSRNSTNHFNTCTNGIFMSCGELGIPMRCRKGGVSDRERKDGEISCNIHADNGPLQSNIEYIANCYRDQRATQKRTGEWKKVAKVLDRFFMWIFFIMVFLMSLLIMGKAI